jgi:hypothetical protein
MVPAEIRYSISLKYRDLGLELPQEGVGNVSDDQEHDTDAENSADKAIMLSKRKPQQPVSDV